MPPLTIHVSEADREKLIITGARKGQKGANMAQVGKLGHMEIQRTDDADESIVFFGGNSSQCMSVYLLT